MHKLHNFFGSNNLRLRLFWLMLLSSLLGILFTYFASGITFNWVSKWILESKSMIAKITVTAMPITIFFLLSFFFTFYLLTRPIIRFLQKTVQSISVIAAGNFEERAPVDRKDELGTVSAHINAMAEQLRIQRERERRDERNRMELIMGISHDLRTPLTSMIGYIHLLKDRGYRSDVEYDGYVEHTYNQAIRLQKRIDALFEYTRLTSPEAKPQLQRIQVKELLLQLLAEYQPIAAKHDLTVSYKLPDGEIVAWIDPDKIVRALDNLLMNALKFSRRPGEIGVHCALLGDRVRFEIENEGEALSIEQEARLFDRFYRIDASRASDNTSLGSGTGLGLAIAQSIARLHGGDLTLYHNGGHYQFRLEFPVRS